MLLVTNVHPDLIMAKTAHIRGNMLGKNVVVPWFHNRVCFLFLGATPFNVLVPFEILSEMVRLQYQLNILLSVT